VKEWEEGWRFEEGVGGRNEGCRRGRKKKGRLKKRGRIKVRNRE
jgi:hypothetical protein